ncbi:hypothetical protein [Mesorhizobium sp. B2-3-4]|uniref:hypothetical protein n=1 Tax=Mesorhizobium sp. B2-3-4 TaxID=2589959 RepID=UPI00112DF0DB|nr:hypothetical protein [Mesorhizobium sp. B2-3-4]TPM28274.1 hypothetical protein FJ967_29270 [Mesorhizobium sp. B2-3-4]
MTIAQGPIYYFCTRQHAYTMGVLLGYYDHGLGEKVRIIPYEHVARLGAVAPGTFIFTDFERLLPPQMQDVTSLYARIARLNPDLPLLNNPAAVLGRFDLLKRLKANGFNDFDVHRLDQRGEIGRFPVFLRWESRHDPPLTGLIDSADGLEKAIAAMPRAVRENPDVMIVEFGAAPSADGRFRKYSAFKVGDDIYAQHCFSSHSWYIKFAEAILGDAERAESRAYAEENPHAAQLDRIFAVAGIDYGRIDYCIVDGRIQTFEINNNPTVMSRPAGWDPGADYSRYATMHARALRGIMRPASGPDLLLGDGGISVDAAHADAMRAVRRRIAGFSLRRRLSLRPLKKRLARMFKRK